jgi:DNA-binding transcriptional MerR regulator
MENKYYQIDEVAKLTGVTKRTIRYYEDLELFKPARTDASYRLYTEEDIEVIREVRNLRIKLGMNLAEIQRFIGLKKTINHILEGSIKDIDKIRETEVKVKDLMALVEEREEVLKKIKNNCKNYLEKMSRTIEHLEER